MLLGDLSRFLEYFAEGSGQAKRQSRHGERIPEEL